jgi:hypothetical protein
MGNCRDGVSVRNGFSHQTLNDTKPAIRVIAVPDWAAAKWE